MIFSVKKKPEVSAENSEVSAGRILVNMEEFSFVPPFPARRWALIFFLRHLKAVRRFFVLNLRLLVVSSLILTPGMNGFL